MARGFFGGEVMGGSNTAMEMAMGRFAATLTAHSCPQYQSASLTAQDVCQSAVKVWRELWQDQQQQFKLKQQQQQQLKLKQQQQQTKCGRTSAPV